MKSKIDAFTVGLRRRASAHGALDVAAVRGARLVAESPDVGAVDGEAGDDLAQRADAGSSSVKSRERRFRSESRSR